MPRFTQLPNYEYLKNVSYEEFNKNYTLNNPNIDLISDATISKRQLNFLSINIIPRLINKIQDLQAELDLSNLANKGYLDGQRNTVKEIIGIINKRIRPEYNYHNEILKDILNTISQKYNVKE